MLGWIKLAPLALGALVLEGHLGGWAVISVENPPRFLEQGGRYRLEFTVRQHGAEPMTGLAPEVRLRWDGGESRVRAVPAAGPGRYQATLDGPRAAEVRLTVDANWHEARLALMPVPVLARGAPGPELTAAQWGRHLFVAKGCGTCHLNGDVPEFAAANRTINVGPELTGRRLEAAYVRQRLVDPASLPRLREFARMPNLGLAPGEVDALVALLTGPTQAASR